MKGSFTVLKTKWITENNGWIAYVSQRKLDEKLDRKELRSKQWPLNYIYALWNVKGLIIQIGKSGANLLFCKLKSVMDFSKVKPVSIDTKSVSIDTLIDSETEIILSVLFFSFCSKMSPHLHCCSTSLNTWKDSKKTLEITKRLKTLKHR